MLESQDQQSKALKSRAPRAWRLTALERLEDRLTPTGAIYSASNVLLPINDLQTTTSRINVPDAVTITDVNVRVNLRHTYTSDLQIRLLAPDGTSALLFNQRGGSGDDLQNTRFDDEAATLVSAGSAPFAGDFRPDNALSTFDGKASQGTWSLVVSDGQAQDTGTLLDWQLELNQPAPVSVPPIIDYPSGPLNVAIPDFTTVTSVITVSDPTIVTDPVVRVDITHPNTEDLIVTLIAPNGQRVRLAQQNGGSSDNFTQTTFRDSAQNSIASGQGPFTGEFRPVDSLAALNGLSGIGNWTLEILDVFDAEQGTLNSWSLNLVSRQSDTNRSVRTPILNQPIGDAVTVLVPLHVTEARAIENINVFVDLTHTYVGDLQLTLIAPDGRRVALVQNRGDNGDNFHNTLFSDQAAFPISAGLAPFTGTFRPVESLRSLDGIYGLGTWQLEIADIFPDADDGILLSWGLDYLTSSGVQVDQLSVASRLNWGASNSATVTLRNTDVAAANNVVVRLVLSNSQGDQIVLGTGTNISIAAGATTNAVINFSLPALPSGWNPNDLFLLEAGLDASSLVADNNDSDNRAVRLVSINQLTTQQTFSTSTPPREIRSNTTTVSTMLVTEPLRIEDLNVGVRFYHPLASTTGTNALTFELIGPDGTIITLENAAGRVTQSGTVIWDDEAPLNNALLLRPQNRLAAFDGILATGEWTLRITAPNIPVTGTLIGWALQVDTQVMLPDLTATQLTVNSLEPVWGSTLTVNYTIQNTGRSASTATTAYLELQTPRGTSPVTTFLASIAIPILAPGQSFSGSTIVVLPNTPPVSLTSNNEWLIQLRVDPLNSVIEANEDNNQNVGFGQDRLRITPQTLITKDPAQGNTLASAQVVTPFSRIAGQIAGGDSVDYYQVTLTQAGRLTSQLAAAQEYIAVTLFDSTGKIILTQAGANAKIDQELLAGNYSILVEHRGPAISPGYNYTLSTQVKTGAALQDPVAYGATTESIVSGDFDHDGTIDFVSLNGNSTITYLSGRGDGTYRLPITTPSNSNFTNIVNTQAADINGDGRLDLVTLHQGTFDPGNNEYVNAFVSVLLGNGDGTFADARVFYIAPNPTALQLADLDGDTKLDIIVAYSGRLDGVSENVFIGSAAISVAFNSGAGRFAAPVYTTVGEGAIDVVVGDFDQDGDTDLVTANKQSKSLTYLWNSGGGSFGTRADTNLSIVPTDLLALDANKNGKLDLVVASSSSTSLVQLVNQGSQVFSAGPSIATNGSAQKVFSKDMNGDGRADLVIVGTNGRVEILINQPDNTFKTVESLRLADPNSVFVEDVNGDGIFDIVSATDKAATLYLGRGDGRLQAPLVHDAGFRPSSLVIGDLNRDGHPDAVVVSGGTVDPVTQQIIGRKVTILAGYGDGTFAPATTQDFSNAIQQVRLADINNDGILDLVGTDLGQYDATPGTYVNGTLFVAFGRGDGTFAAPTRYNVGVNNPIDLQVVDLNQDGRLDIVVLGSKLAVVYGQANNTFSAAKFITIPSLATAFALGDVDGDNQRDIVVSYGSADDPQPNGINTYRQTSTGDFSLLSTLVLTNPASTVALADLDGNKTLELIYTQNQNVIGGTTYAQQIIVRTLNNQTWVSPNVVAISRDLDTTQLRDLNQDGRLDLVGTQLSGDTLSIYLGTTTGFTGTPAVEVKVGGEPASFAIADINRDSRLDILTASRTNDSLTALLQNNGPTFGYTSKSADTSVPIVSVPLAADINRDGIVDRVVLDATGQVLLRLGIAGGQFGVTQVLNPGRPVRDVTLATTGTLNAEVIMLGTDSILRFFSTNPNGARVSAVVLGDSANLVRAADLDADGVAELIVTSSNGTASILRYSSLNGWTETTKLTTAPGIRDIEIRDVNGDVRPDLLFLSEYASTVDLFVQSGTGFTNQGRFDTSLATTSPVLLNGQITQRSFEGSIDFVSGSFDQLAGVDLVVLHRESSTLQFISGRPEGGFGAPQLSNRLSLIATPDAVVSGDWDGDGDLDLAILYGGLGKIQIALNDGNGKFALQSKLLDAGTNATGIASLFFDGNNRADLVISNTSGDAQILYGTPEGTLKSLVVNNRSRVVAQDINNDGLIDFLIADEETNTTTVLVRNTNSPTGFTETFRTTNTATLPTNGAIGPLNNDKSVDAVVVSRGSNEVIVYRGLGNGQFDSSNVLRIAVGSNPVSATISDLNDDGINDLVVVNEGSNDVSIFFGQLDNQGEWSAVAGPRVATGAFTPEAVTVTDTNNDGIIDLIITHRDGGAVSSINGVGGGYFNDQKANVIQTTTTSNPSVTPVSLGKTGIVAAVVGQQILGFVPGSGTNQPTVLANLPNAGSVRFLNSVNLSGGTSAGFAFATSTGLLTVFTPPTDPGLGYIPILTQQLPNIDALRSLVVYQTASGTFESFTSYGGSSPVLLDNFQAFIPISPNAPPVPPLTGGGTVPGTTPDNPTPGPDFTGAVPVVPSVPPTPNGGLDLEGGGGSLVSVATIGGGFDVPSEAIASSGEQFVSTETLADDLFRVSLDTESGDETEATDQEGSDTVATAADASIAGLLNILNDGDESSKDGGGDEDEEEETEPEIEEPVEDYRDFLIPLDERLDALGLGDGEALEDITGEEWLLRFGAALAGYDPIELNPLPTVVAQMDEATELASLVVLHGAQVPLEAMIHATPEPMVIVEGPAVAELIEEAPPIVMERKFPWILTLFSLLGVVWLHQREPRLAKRNSLPETRQQPRS